MTEPYPEERWLSEQMRDRVERLNLNCITILTGPTGSGKSWGALDLAERTDPGFRDNPKTAIDRVVFPPTEFLSLAAETALPDKSSLVWDDAGLGMPSRKWFDFLNQAVGFVAQSFRFRRLLWFITVPDKAFIDSIPRRLHHFEIEYFPRRDPEAPGRAKVFEVSTSSRLGKTYLKYPRLRVGRQVVKLTSVRFSRPSDELVALYEAKRSSYMMELYDTLQREAESALDRDRFPKWAYRALLSLSEHFESQASLARELGISREWVNRLLKRAREVLRIA